MPRLQLKGVNLTPRRDSFDPIETASRDEIGALQLKRMKWTLNHAYGNVAHYKKVFDKAGVHPDDIKACVYTMRFDRASTHYAEFGPFVTGMVAPLDDVLRRVGIG